MDLPFLKLALESAFNAKINFLIQRSLGLMENSSRYLIYANYHAKASGASPPGPGQISSNFAISALLNLIFSARRLPVNCSSVRGPIIGAVTTGFANNHAR